MRLIDPGGQGGSTDRTTAARLTSLQGKRIGLLANGKANAEALIRATAAHFETNHGCTVVDFFDKKNASRPAEVDDLEALAQDTDFLITAVGD